MSVDVITIGGGVGVVTDSSGGVAIVTTSGVSVIATGDGVPGQAAGQDIGMGPMTGVFTNGEVLNFPRVAHDATFTTLQAQTDSGVALSQILTIQQMRLGTPVGTATIMLTPGNHTFEETLGAPLVFLYGDYPKLTMPNPADAQLDDLTLTLGSNP